VNASVLPILQRILYAPDDGCSRHFFRHPDKIRRISCTRKHADSEPVSVHHRPTPACIKRDQTREQHSHPGNYPEGFGILEKVMPEPWEPRWVILSRHDRGQIRPLQTAPPQAASGAYLCPLSLLMAFTIETSWATSIVLVAAGLSATCEGTTSFVTSGSKSTAFLAVSIPM